ncbi:hypothetical protein IEQ34_019845 [Dendrobium chrysotoxum]|uniref:VQ domain-containing protein n=1 Tax=Dendrobium chrysotoxum TaxID=161865 RepID=A0AAV7G852_DENCH|nr:hypothetical protein IEQ34_019845 [Dendrobium chrysotoxum]
MWWSGEVQGLRWWSGEEQGLRWWSGEVQDLRWWSGEEKDLRWWSGEEQGLRWWSGEEQGLRWWSGEVQDLRWWSGEEQGVRWWSGKEQGLSLSPHRPKPMDRNLSHRRELQLQGPRPSPLRVSKDSHKIMKPSPLPQQQREPVIIYTISPKVIHVEPANFMGLVQRLTGPDRAAADPPMTSSAALERPVAIRPGILLPVPTSLPPIPPAFFSSSSLDPSFQSFLHDMSPVGFQVGRPSHGNFDSPKYMGLSPGHTAGDIFSQLLRLEDGKEGTTSMEDERRRVQSS